MALSDQIRIPCVMMRGGTSRGPVFLASDLPADPHHRDAVLLSVMGAGHDLEIDGIGGGNPLTSKVAIVGPASVPGADVDYLFAQVRVRDRIVDTSPNCGNMLAAVGPFAIEAGLVRPAEGLTRIRIHNVNTGKLIEARIMTPGGHVVYEGGASIDGVPGTAAPIQLAFLDAAGAKTGRLLPTGAPVDLINGIEVSCVDAATPSCSSSIRSRQIRPRGGGQLPHGPDLHGEARSDADRGRSAHGVPRCGLPGDPEAGADRPAATGGTLVTRYFMPHECHRALAVTGAIAAATACVTPGTIAASLAGPIYLPTDITLEHPSGRIVVRLEPGGGRSGPVASVQRTARRIFEGAVFARRSHLPHDMRRTG